MQKASIFVLPALCMMVPALAPTTVVAQGACPEGSFSVVHSADGATLSVLFDDFIVSAPQARRGCDLQIPLNLPEGQSLGVYRVDYRGFAHLGAKQRANLTVVHHLGADRKGHRYRRKVNGVHDSEFSFTENIGAGLMKRAGCGDEAVLNISIAMDLEGAEGSDALASLDSSDGAPKGGLVYHLDTKKC